MVVTETQRDTKNPTPKKGGTAAKPASDVMVDSIPTELLAPYTAIMALIVEHKGAAGWEAQRWIIYGVTAALVPAAVWVLWSKAAATGVKRKVPVAGMAGSALGFGAWGLVMPGGPLTVSVTDAGTFTILSAIIIALATIVIGWLLPLKEKVKAK